MKKSIVLFILASIFLVGLLGSTAFAQCEAYGSRSNKSVRVHQKAHYHKYKKNKKAQRKFTIRRHF